MMVTQYGQPEDRTVEWEAIWLDPNFRRRGIAKQAYEKIQRWTEAQGYRRVITFIRTDNERARHIRQKQGERLVSTKHDEVWADGSIGDVHTFILDLYPKISRPRQVQALRRLNEATQFYDDEQKVPDRVSFEITTSR